LFEYSKYEEIRVERKGWDASVMDHPYTCSTWLRFRAAILRGKTIDRLGIFGGFKNSSEDGLAFSSKGRERSQEIHIRFIAMVIPSLVLDFQPSFPIQDSCD
jgi:hypothetical protein